jgi:hypothetical protein
MHLSAEQVYDAFSEQIYTCRDKAYRQGVRTPELRSVITYRSKMAFMKAMPFQVTYSTPCLPPTKDCDFEFQGSFITVIPGDDHFFQTRCTNLPE